MHGFPKGANNFGRREYIKLRRGGCGATLHRPQPQLPQPPTLATSTRSNSKMKGELYTPRSTILRWWFQNQRCFLLLLLIGKGAFFITLKNQRGPQFRRKRGGYDVPARWWHCVSGMAMGGFVLWFLQCCWRFSMSTRWESGVFVQFGEEIGARVQTLFLISFFLVSPTNCMSIRPTNCMSIRCT